MDSICINPEIASTAPAFAENEPEDLGFGSNFLYQAATVLGMLLFLFSF
jgi:hypothetical protein